MVMSPHQIDLEFAVRIFAIGLRQDRLQDIPVLDELAIFDAEQVVKRGR